MINKDIYRKIQNGEIDPNNQTLFFSNLYKAFIYNLNRNISIRGISLPHYLLTTGDDFMYLEKKGYDYSKEPLEVTNEQYIYSVTPRCILELGGVEVLTEQLTSPYSKGKYELEIDNNIYEFVAEFRRFPIKTSIEGKYCFDTLTDCLEATQHIITKLMFLQTFSFSYMGQQILCTYNIPANIDRTVNLQFDESTTDNRYRILNVTYELETNIPVYNVFSSVSTEDYISNTELCINTFKQTDIKNNEQSLDNIKYKIDV